MIRTIIASVCLVAAYSIVFSPTAYAKDPPASSAPTQNASVQDVPKSTAGPVTEEDYIEVEYGHYDDYIAWLTSKWKPTMEALKKAGLIIDYHVFRADPRSPGLPNFILWITFKNGGAALDKQAEIEAVTDQVICSTDCQNKARVFRNQYRKVLGIELIRELILP